MYKRPSAALVLAALIAPFAALAQSVNPDRWPEKPIQVIVPASSGSGTDNLARVTFQRLSAALGQPIVVENRVGGGGAIGTGAVVKAASDGYTLLYTNGTFAVMTPALLGERVPYDPVRDLTPIVQTAVGGVLLLVNPAVPAKNLAELVELVKANPGKYSYGTWAVGSSGHLIMEWLQNRTGMKMSHVPYKSVPQLLTELSSGVIPIGWADPSAPVPFIRSGKVRGIAISGNVRVPGTPDIAPMGEQGYQFDAVGWFGMFGPANLPEPIVRRIHAEINRIQSTDDMKALMARLNFEPPPMKSNAEFRDIVRNDFQIWRKIVQDNNITAE